MLDPFVYWVFNLIKMKEIQLSQGKVALVDDEDFERVNKYKWHARKSLNTFYAERNIKTTKCRTKIQMHRFILNIDISTKDRIEVDHKNNNGLDNYKLNLRLCSRSQNAMNCKSKVISSSNYKGVSWNKRSNKYFVKIKKNGVPFYLGLFESEIEAAKAYDDKAKELFGEFAYLNFK